MPTIFDKYNGRPFDVVHYWGPVDDDSAPMPTISIGGYTLEYVPSDDFDGGFALLDGQRLDGATFEKLDVGWAVYYSSTGCTYQFVTIFKAMAHAHYYLV